MLPIIVKQARPLPRYLLLALLASSCGSDAPLPPQPTAAPQVQAKAPALDIEQSLRLRIGENPSDVEALTRLGDLYYDRQRHQEAIPLYLEALELTPANVSIRTDLGTCYVSLKQFEKARAAYEQVMLEDPTHLNATFNMGVVESAEGNHEQAAVFWDRAAALATNPSQAQQIRQMAEQARQRTAAQTAGQ